MHTYEKILIISDVHGRIDMMGDFFQYLLEEKKEKINFAVHLGDFWSGRNYDPKTNTQVRHEFDDLDYFKKLSFPIYHIRGNEDLVQPNNWWFSPNMWLMHDQKPFNLNSWKILPIDYHHPGSKDDEVPEHPEYSLNDGFDIILSHRPPMGILDETLHFKTHERLTNTGSPLVRKYYDKIKPALMLFGHFHFCNYKTTDNGLVVCFDKLLRTGGANHDQLKYSYGLLDPFDQSLTVYWKNRLYFKYLILEQKFQILNHLEKHFGGKSKKSFFFNKKKRESERDSKLEESSEIDTEF
ncbi:MAG: metallophosphoesterase family protein [Promethearchaeota archaeon]